MNLQDCTIFGTYELQEATYEIMTTL